LVKSTVVARSKRPNATSPEPAMTSESPAAPVSNWIRVAPSGRSHTRAPSACSVPEKSTGLAARGS